MATKFTQARILKKDPSAKDVCNLIEEAWIAWAGRPEKLRVDEDGPHTGHEILEWVDMWAIYLEVVAGERSW